MSQVSLYMDDYMMGLLRDRSEKERVSISKYVAQIVRDHVDGRQDAWPVGYWESVYGCLSDNEANVMRETCKACETCEAREAAGRELAPSALDESLDDACDWFAGGEA